MKIIGHVIHYEIMQITREKRFFLPFIIAPLLFIALQSVFLWSGAGQMFTEEIRFFIKRLYMLLIWIISSLAIPLSADSFAGEKERNTLDLLFTVPVASREIFWGKVLGILPFPVFFAWVSQIVMFLILVTYIPFSSKHVIDLLSSMLLAPGMTAIIISITVLISMKSSTVRATTQTTSLFMFLILLVFVLVSHFSYLHWAFEIILSLSLFLLALVLGFYSSRKFVI